MTTTPFTRVELTPEQDYAMAVARTGFMTACPFFAHYFYAEMREVPSLDVPTAATDGRHLIYNPEYLAGLKPAERVFVLAHEVHHAISQHPIRMKHYSQDGNDVRGVPYDQKQFNFAADYTINADLIDNGIGVCNPSWLFKPDVAGEDLTEEVYGKIYKKKPDGQGSTFGGSGKAPKGAKGDSRADSNGGGFDELLPPPVDPVTGREDTPDPAEFREAIARAAAAAKAMGKMPGSFQRMVDEILNPQISWREHIRMLITAKIGSRRETWDRPNRRRLVLNPMVILPGRAGHGAGTVVVVADSSGSIGDKELSAYFGELTGILSDVRPKRVVLIWCDAAIQRVDEAASLTELESIRVQGGAGGGGTSFIPPFDYVAENDLRPDALVYLTDLMGPFPDKAPAYPVIWCATTKDNAPWGETVHIEV